MRRLQYHPGHSINTRRPRLAAAALALTPRSLSPGRVPRVPRTMMYIATVGVVVCFMLTWIWRLRSPITPAKAAFHPALLINIRFGHPIPAGQQTRTALQKLLPGAWEISGSGPHWMALRGPAR